MSVSCDHVLSPKRVNVAESQTKYTAVPISEETDQRTSTDRVTTLETKPARYRRVLCSFLRLLSCAIAIPTCMLVLVYVLTVTADHISNRLHCFGSNDRVESQLRARGQDPSFNPWSPLKSQPPPMNLSSFGRLQMEILYRYRPVVRLDSRELYFPVCFVPVEFK